MTNVDEYKKMVKEREEHELKVFDWMLTNYNQRLETWSLKQVLLVYQIILHYEKEFMQNKGEAT